MAGMRIGLVALALALLAPAVAEAGTYDVVSCRAPGAGGVNNSLEYSAGSVDPQYAAAAPGWYEAETSCADGLVARSRTVDGTFAKWLTGAGWSFTAPAGTEIVGFTHWRFAEARDGGGDDPNTPYEDEGEHWEVVVAEQTGTVGRPVVGETCSHGTDRPLCTIGVPGGERTSHRVLTQKLSWNVGCGGQIVDGCYTSYGRYPLATMVVYGTQVTLEDEIAPRASLAGSLLGPGWHRPGEPVIYSATDNTGIRSASLSSQSKIPDQPASGPSVTRTESPTPKGRSINSTQPCDPRRARIAAITPSSIGQGESEALPSTRRTPRLDLAARSEVAAQNRAKR